MTDERRRHSGARKGCAKSRTMSPGTPRMRDCGSDCDWSLCFTLCDCDAYMLYSLWWQVRGGAKRKPKATGSAFDLYTRAYCEIYTTRRNAPGTRVVAVPAHACRWRGNVAPRPLSALSPAHPRPSRSPSANICCDVVTRHSTGKTHKHTNGTCPWTMSMSMSMSMYRPS